MSAVAPAPKSTQPVQQKSAPMSGGASSSRSSPGAVQLKQSLPGHDFARQEAMLAPLSIEAVQMRASDGSHLAGGGPVAGQLRQTAGYADQAALLSAHGGAGESGKSPKEEQLRNKALAFGVSGYGPGTDPRGWLYDADGKPVRCIGPTPAQRQAAKLVTFDELLQGSAGGGAPAPNFQLDRGPVTFGALDNNPAKGVMDQQKLAAKVDAGRGGGPGAGGKKAHSPQEGCRTLFGEFLDLLERIDGGLKGDASQSWGMSFTGKAKDGSESTAARPTKNCLYLNKSSGDLNELFEIFDLLLVTMGDKVPGDMKASLKAKKDELFSTYQAAKSDPGAKVFDLFSKVEEINDAFGGEALEKKRAVLGQKILESITMFKAVALQIDADSLPTAAAKFVHDKPTQGSATTSKTPGSAGGKTPTPDKTSQGGKGPAVKKESPAATSGGGGGLVLEEYLAQYKGSYVCANRWVSELTGNDELVYVVVDPQYAAMLMKEQGMPLTPIADIQTNPKTKIQQVQSFSGLYRWQHRPPVIFVKDGPTTCKRYLIRNDGDYDLTYSIPVSRVHDATIFDTPPAGIVYHEK